MSINSLNLYRQNKYYYANQGGLTYNYQPKTVSLSSSAVSNPVLNQDTFEYSSTTNQSANSRILELKNKFQTIKHEQGWIAKPVDWFKNLFNTQNCSNNIEIAINNLNEHSTEEEFQAVEKMLNKYSSNQDSAVKGVASTAAMMTGGAVGAKAGAAIGSVICPGIGIAAGILIGAAVGAASSIFVNQIENMTDDTKGNSWQNDENILKEASEGALSGGSAVLMGGITQKVTGAVASKVGLSSVKYGGKTTLVALAEDGVTAKVGSTVAKNALASAVGSGTAAAAISGGSYAIECAVDKDKDFSLTDFGTTAATSFAFGGLIGGMTGGIQGYKGANGYNASVHEAQIQAEAQARIQAETEAKIRAQKAQEKYNKPFEEKLSHKAAEESAKVFEAQGKSEYEVMLDKQARIHAEVQTRKAEMEAIEHARQTQDDLIETVYNNGKIGTDINKRLEYLTLFTENPELVSQYYHGEISKEEFVNKMYDYLVKIGKKEILDRWGLSKEGYNQLIMHTYCKTFDSDPTRMFDIQEYLENIGIEVHPSTLEGFHEATVQLDKYIKEKIGTTPAVNGRIQIGTNVKDYIDAWSSGDKVIYWLSTPTQQASGLSVPNSKSQGILIIKYKNLFQSVFNAPYNSFLQKIT